METVSCVHLTTAPFVADMRIVNGLVKSFIFKLLHTSFKNVAYHMNC